MNEKTDSTTDTEDKQKQPAKRDGADKAKSSKRPRSHRAGWLALLFFLIAVLGAVSAGYLWLELREFRGARAWNVKQLRQLETQMIELRTQVIPRAELEQRFAAGNAMRQQLQDQLVTLRENIAHLRQLSQGGRQAWQRAQVVYLVQLAQDELLLAGNINSALTALRAADTQLRQLAGSRLQTVRAAIHEDIAALQALPNPDITGMALTLNALATQTDSLPLKAQAADEYRPADAKTPDPEQGFWQRLWSGLKNGLSTMISVRRTQTPVKPLLTANQEALVYQQLALQLHTARLALLTGDYANYRASLVSAQNWLTRWFDTSHNASQAFLADLERLLETPLPATLPTLSAPQALHSLPLDETLDKTGGSP